MNRGLTIGGPIALIAIGLLAMYAIADAIPGVNLFTAGLILAVIGGVWLIISIVMGSIPRKTVHESHTDAHVDRV